MTKFLESLIRQFVSGTDETFYRAQRRWQI